MIVSCARRYLALLGCCAAFAPLALLFRYAVLTPLSFLIPPLRRFKWIGPGYVETMGNRSERGQMFRHRFRITLGPSSFRHLEISAVALATPAQAPPLPAPEATDPVKLETMKGFPPPPDKIVRLSSVLKFPNGRWAFHHMRELGPTTQVWRGDEKPSLLREAPQDLGLLGFEDDKGGKTTLGDWQRATFTDGLLVLHKGQIVYEKYFGALDAERPHMCFSVTKSFVATVAAVLIHEGVLDEHAPVARYLPELAAGGFADATIRQLLDMTTGIAYVEDYTDDNSSIWSLSRAGGFRPRPAGYAGPETFCEYVQTLEKATGVRIDGVRWPLAEATLRVGRSRGLSNEVVEPPASVSLERGTLLVVEHPEVAAEGHRRARGRRPCAGSLRAAARKSGSSAG